MNAYELKQYQAIEKWKVQKPSVVSQAVGLIASPISWVIKKVVPTKAIEGALTGFSTVAELLTDQSDIKRDAQVVNITDLRTKDMQLSDSLANSVHNWALAAASSEGVVTGTLGLPGLVADIPTIITLGLRTIYKIGLCYGFENRTLEDKQFVYTIFSIAGANSMKEKYIALATLKQIEVIIAKTAWKKMAEKAIGDKLSKEAAIIAIKNLAKTLGINLTKRKALQAIPIIGAGVGATVNAAFINDISWAARRSYQELWLRQNGRIECYEHLAI